MQPKNDFQRLVVEVDSKLPKITREQEEYAFDKCLPHFSVYTKSGIHSCLDCGHRWYYPFNMVLCGITCPSCNKDLEVKSTRDRTFKSQSYYTVITRLEGFQVVRLFMVYGRYKVGKPSECWAIELYRVYIDGKGRSEVIGMFETSRYYECWGGGFELRSKTSSSDYFIHTKVIFNETSFLPELKRNGFKRSLHGINPRVLFSELLSNPVFETLWKAKMFNVLKFYGSDYRSKQKVLENFSTLKICIRNGYTISDASMYFDYLDLLAHFRKDLKNAKFVCPDDLKRQHDKLVNKKRGIDRKTAYKEQVKKLRDEDREYKRAKKAFLGLVFIENDLCVKVLESVEEFKVEGEIHQHCVYVNGYHRRRDSLIFSAKVDGKPVETVEFSLRAMKVVQSRGFGNKISKYNERIRSLVNENIKAVKKRYLKSLKTA